MTQVIGRSQVFSTPWFAVVAKTVRGSDPGAPYYALELQDYVSVLALTEAGQVLLVRQYRPAVEDYTLELPSGHVEAGESPEVAARRELVEETGYTADAVDLLGCLAPDTGRLSNRLWCFFASGVRAGDPGLALEEGIELIVCSQGDLARHIEGQQLTNVGNLALILLASLKGKLTKEFSGDD